MTDSVEKAQQDILKETLPHVAFEGWSLETVERGAQEAGYDRDMVKAVFPAGIPDVLASFSRFLDDCMMEKIATEDPQEMKVRERIRTATYARFQAVEIWREAERLALCYWSRPGRQIKAASLLWRTADTIWIWAGDTSEDYNYYTKRSLLSGVIGTTTLAWLDTETGDLESVDRFLRRRIENVLTLGGFLHVNPAGQAVNKIIGGAIDAADRFIKKAAK